MSSGLVPIGEIAQQLGLDESDYEPYGRYTAKLSLDLIEKSASRPQGKLILVTAIHPTTHGEGKTVVSIGLAQAICKHGRRGLITSREPSLGPVFGMKGGATGGGRSRVEPSNQINLHFTGDFHAITSAHNLLAAAIDSHIHHGNALRIDINNISWPRTMDMNDRALRRMVIALGGKINGVPREAGFVITAASEIMAILALASSRADMRHRLDSIVIGYDMEGQPVRAEALKVTGAMMVVLAEALLPNLVQTTENTPALVHGGPFANIAHGTSSVLAQRIALGLGEYVVNETGFGADLGAEKYFDIVMRSSGLKPSAAVVVVTARAMATHGAGVEGQGAGPELVERGLPNLARHLSNLRKFGVPVVVAINQFPADTPEELGVIEAFCERDGVPCARVDVYRNGGEGALELAEKAMAAADASDATGVHSLYAAELSLEEKIETIASEIYGASHVSYDALARRKLKKFADLGYGNVPVCIAKTQYSFSDNPKLLGAPTDWRLTISDANLSAGAGFVVAIAGAMMLMPGLPKVPHAEQMDLLEDGTVVGMDW
ncbi:MAG TPA: formate--tetrahydrofolate ligase [Blastocatellia bacterium]|nr:formate--tetrahydrofolate ligase [Blastocatellia bacterium]